MQISVLKPNDENVKRLQGVIDYVYRAYDMNAVECYIVKDDGEIKFNHLEVKNILDILRASCKNINEPIKDVCNKFNKELRRYGTDKPVRA